MGYGMLEGNSARDRLQTQDSARRNQEAGDKIAEFFKARGAGVVRSICTHQAATKIEIAPTEAGLCVRHRGNEIQVSSTRPALDEAAFRQWCSQEMTHVKVFPRRQAAQH